MICFKIIFEKEIIMDQYLFPLKKSIDKKHRIAEAIQNIKDSLLKVMIE